MNSIVRRLSRLDIASLEELAGVTIVKAVQGAYDTNRERALAKLVVDKHGEDLLRVKKVRVALIQSLDSEESVELARIWTGKRHSEFKSYQVNEEIFSKPYSQPLVESFVEFLNLPMWLIPRSVVDERTESEFVVSKFGEQLKSRGVLHDYQRFIKDESVKLINSGHTKFMIQMPTGAGKTVTALEILVDYLRSDFSGLIVWIVNSTELAEQTLEAFKSLWQLRGDRAIWCHRYFGKFNPDFVTAKGIVFACFEKSNESMESAKEGARKNFEALCKACRLVVVDEAHSSTANTYEAVIQSLIQNSSKLIGLTATPAKADYEDNLALSRMYGKNLIAIDVTALGSRYKSAIDYLRDGGYLAQIEVETLDGDAQVDAANPDKACRKLAENSLRNTKIVDQIERAVKLGDSTIVFSCTKDHVLALVALCRARNIDVDFVVGETSTHRRVEILDRLRRKDLLVVINHEILSTGIDVPNINRLIITRPVGSTILYSQIVGRALRGPKNGGNTKNTIVNIRDNLYNYPSEVTVFESFANNFIA